MYTRLNNIFNLIIKGLFETASVSISGILLLYFFSGIDSAFTINMILTLSLANYLCAYSLYFYVSKSSNIKHKMKFIIIFFAVALSLISAFITSREVMIIYFIIYLFVWYKSVISITGERHINSVKNNFVVTVVLFFVMIFILTIFDGDSITAQKIKLLFPIYVGVSLSYFATVNLITAYNKRNSNFLNKTKNIKIINLIINSLILIILAFALTGFWGLWDKLMSSQILMNLWGIILKIIEIILYPIVFFLSKIIEFVFRKADFSILDKLNSGEIPEQVEEIANQTLSPKAQAVMSTALSVVKWGIMILAIYLVIFYIIRALNNRIPLSNEGDDEEEKEFILSPEDIRKKIERSLKRLALNSSRLFSKSQNNSHSLPIIRRIYLDTILTLKEKGYEFEIYHTPNEYVSKLKKSEYINTGIEDLTYIYNEYRYGGKDPTEEEINQCINVKNNIYIISKEK